MERTRGDPQGAIVHGILMRTIQQRTITACEIERRRGLRIERALRLHRRIRSSSFTPE
jgi:hypothetical protein